MNRKIVFTRERESATYRIEVSELGAPIESKDGRSYEWCLLAEHIEQVKGSHITWQHRGVEPELSEAALRGCVNDAMITVAARARDRHHNDSTRGEKPRQES